MKAKVGIYSWTKEEDHKLTKTKTFKSKEKADKFVNNFGKGVSYNTFGFYLEARIL